MHGHFISGMGVVCALGLNCKQTLASFRSGGRPPVCPTFFDSPLPLPVFEVQGFEKDHPYEEGARTLALVLCAIQEALQEAALTAEDLASRRVGVCLGTTVASQLNDLEFYRLFKQTGTAPMGPVRRYLKGNLADAVAEHFGLNGPSLTVSNACSSGADAIAIGAQWIEAGLCDMVIAGGGDELSQVAFGGFNSLGLGSSEPCRPFDKNRKGLNLGEGAGVFLLESRSCAAGRNHSSDLFLSGYGSACDAYHLTAPRPDGAGLRMAIAHALSSANAAPGEIAFVNAHGTGTQENDLVEGNALAAVFGTTLPVLSTKGYTGHTLGAAGGIEAVFTGMGLRAGWIPSSAGFEQQDERIALTPLRQAVEITGRLALSTSLAFGGNNTALLIGISK